LDTERTAVRLAPPPGEAAAIHAALGPLAAVVGTAEVAPVEAIATGNLALDAALGVGGLPRGRITEVYGAEGSGKTTLALAVIAQAQREGGTACYVDAEHALDLGWAEVCGVDVAQLLLHQPDSGEQALAVCKALVNSGAVDVLVIDSIAAIVPQAELDGEIGAHRPGLQARLLSDALRRLNAKIATTGTLLLATNQLRERAGVEGAPVYSSGGRALGYYASVRLDLRPLGEKHAGGQVVGRRIAVTVAKSKVSRPGQVATVEIRHDSGLATGAKAAAKAVAATG
jgi:recombination protein RecA